MSKGKLAHAEKQRNENSEALNSAYARIKELESEIEGIYQDLAGPDL